jgi:hypothetical protein
MPDFKNIKIHNVALVIIPAKNGKTHMAEELKRYGIIDLDAVIHDNEANAAIESGFIDTYQSIKTDLFKKWLINNPDIEKTIFLTRSNLMFTKDVKYNIMAKLKLNKNGFNDCIKKIQDITDDEKKHIWVEWVQSDYKEFTKKGLKKEIKNYAISLARGNYGTIKIEEKFDESNEISANKEKSKNEKKDDKSDEEIYSTFSDKNICLSFIKLSLLLIILYILLGAPN